MSVRKIRRAAEREARKAARKGPAQTPPSAALVATLATQGEAPQTQPTNSEILKALFASEVQLAANRANAKLSTGPKTPEGRAIAAGNSFKHGLSFGSRFSVADDEDSTLYALQRDQFIADLQPTPPIEQMLVERIAQHTWLFERATALELQLFSNSGMTPPPPGQEKRLTLYQRYAADHERAANRNLNQLLKLRKDRQSLENGFVRVKQQTELHEARLTALQDPLKAAKREVQAEEKQFRASEERLAAFLKPFKGICYEKTAQTAA